MTTQLPRTRTADSSGRSSSHPSAHVPGRACTLAVRLDREWQAMAVRPALLRRARTWGVGVPFASLPELLAATGHRPAASPGTVHDGTDHNAVVARLLMAARGDDLAARVLLQRLLPGLVGVARKWQRRHGSATDPFDEVVAAAWAVVREFPLERRPSHLVANLLRDAEYHAFVRPRRRTLVLEPVATERLDQPVSPTLDAFGELAEVVACTSSLDDHDRRLLGLLLSGRTTLQVAAALHVSERTVRAHRDSMVVRMRQAVAA